MRLSKIMLAVSAIAISGSVLAEPNGNRVAYTAGASASLANMIAAITSLCPNTVSTFANGNFTTLVCHTGATALTAGTSGTYDTASNGTFVDFTGLGFAEVRINSEGSFSAVLLTNAAPLQFRDPLTNSTTTTLPSGAVPVGGILDLDPKAFPASTIGTNVLFESTAVGVGQTFGVAASVPLYNAMFADQKTNGFIPASCNLADTGIPACVPSIGKGQMATIMADNSFNAAYSKGANFLAPSLAEGTELRYVRRVDNSGTQAVAQNYFLGLPCSTSALSIVAEPTTDDEVGGLKDALIGAIRVMAAPSTGNVRTELNKANIYAIGVVSGENNQTGQNWKWLRVGGAPMGANATPGTAMTNTDTRNDGTYDFYYESVYVGGTATGNAFWATLSSAMNTLPAPVGLVNNSTLTAGYNKAGQACNANSSN